MTTVVVLRGFQCKHSTSTSSPSGTCSWILSLTFSLHTLSHWLHNETVRAKPTMSHSGVFNQQTFLIQPPTTLALIVSTHIIGDQSQPIITK